jgi:hypothetical protein
MQYHETRAVKSLAPYFTAHSLNRLEKERPTVAHHIAGIAILMRNSPTQSPYTRTGGEPCASHWHAFSVCANCARNASDRAGVAGQPEFPKLQFQSTRGPN